MTDIETVEQMNEVIARFDGWEEWEHAKGYWTHPERNITSFHQIHELKYHSDWRQLMPVIEKISKQPLLNSDGTLCEHWSDTCYPITFNMPNEEGRVMFRFKGFGLFEADTLIEAAYRAVVDFIQWYNNTLNKQP